MNSAVAVAYILLVVMFGLLMWVIFDPPLGESNYGSPPITVFHSDVHCDTVYVLDTVVAYKTVIPKTDTVSNENAAIDSW